VVVTIPILPPTAAAPSFFATACVSHDAVAEAVAAFAAAYDIAVGAAVDGFPGGAATAL
jgi:deoxyribose-phosphate aldolase